MRTRARLLIGFVAVHLVLTVVMGVIAWNWLDQSMRAQAEESARSVGRVLAQGGFPLTDEVMAKMRALTGYEFRVLPVLSEVRPGTVQVAEAGKVVEVDYRRKLGGRICKRTPSKRRLVSLTMPRWWRLSGTTHG